jgi:hypothetical protein
MEVTCGFRVQQSYHRYHGSKSRRANGDGPPRLPKAPLPLCGWQLQPGENRQSGEAANPIPTNAAIDTTDKNAFVKISSAGWMRAASGTGGGGPG